MKVVISVINCVTIPFDYGHPGIGLGHNSFPSYKIGHTTKWRRVDSKTRALRISFAHSCLEVRRVNYRPPGTQQNLLDEVSFSLPEKSFGLIFGRSGSGKTTLLHLLAGLSKPTSGSITIQRYGNDGNPSQSSEPLAPESVGMVFQFPERYTIILGQCPEMAVFSAPRWQNSGSKGRKPVSIKRRLSSFPAAGEKHSRCCAAVQNLEGWQEVLQQMPGPLEAAGCHRRWAAAAKRGSNSSFVIQPTLWLGLALAAAAWLSGQPLAGAPWVAVSSRGGRLLLSWSVAEAVGWEHAAARKTPVAAPSQGQQISSYFLADTILEEMTFGWPRQKADFALRERLALKLQYAINSVGLNNISLDEDPHSLSGGYKRRLALAIQLVQTPQLLLLDEPLAGLDWKARADVVKLLKHLKKELTILVVSHDLRELSSLVDRSWRMQMGGILKEEALPL
ncbi:hypothetical protein ZIOFF_030940 [Zingiber officinale]|uniref:ABC transporter domain-containing protein n=1 Tax=Zingiber officinale TaxID=94328 RepID=A0A8J5GYQ7_ZINOF|nr:hypothetical protein ZIOFF_030940 [Zingiber officinale]